MPSNDLDADFGVAPPAGAPHNPQRESISAVDPKALGAKVLQSATLGFGADAARIIAGKQAENAIRSLSNAYDQQHPMYGFAIDMAVAGAESLVPGLGEAKDAQMVAKVGMGGAKALAAHTAAGAGFGAAAGAGAGGNAAARTTNAVEGGVEGAVASLGLGVLGHVFKTALTRAGGYSQVKAAADQIKRTLAAKGWTPTKLDQYVRQNPNTRLVDIPDVGPKIADLVAKASAQSNDTARQLSENLREDAGDQMQRLRAPASRFAGVKAQMIDDLKDLQSKKDAAYRNAYAEVTPLSSELKAALDHPDVKPLVDGVLEDYQKLRMNPKSAVAAAPKYKVGVEIPTAVIDDLQKQIGKAANDRDVIGTMKAGALQAAHSALKDAQPETLDAAQRLAAVIGGVDSKTGLLGAQDWGYQYAHAMKSAPIEHFQSMQPLEQQYARIGMVSGFEQFLGENPRMPAAKLDKLADVMKDPRMVEVLGKRDAARVRAALMGEASRAKRNEEMARGGARKVAFEEHVQESTAAHFGNAVGGNAIGSFLRLAAAKGMSEKQARTLIDTATKPGGVERLRAAGVDRKLLDRLPHGVVPRGLAAAQVSRYGQPEVDNN